MVRSWGGGERPGGGGRGPVVVLVLVVVPGAPAQWLLAFGADILIGIFFETKKIQTVGEVEPSVAGEQEISKRKAALMCPSLRGQCARSRVAKTTPNAGDNGLYSTIEPFEAAARHSIV
jgi:hypothetical protein